MPKLPRQAKNPSKTPTPDDFIQTYDAVVLYNALQSFENSLGWDLFKAYSKYIQRDYEVKALDMLGKGENNQSAAYASGYAKACEELLSGIEGLRQTVLGKSQAIENPRPED